ncbi:hypothetical protein EW146_g3764 [Bondarzewia mesenterica]|uniref:RED-like N-terminal domain-containing protein n=1 Tax=Bondarzewia mesenterica TaxID=1095465 RepID=A0A4S4LYF4_9AGAM|nr:hypothetical protein EW146_g3764 [Bondarzewia mesenterica]
MDQDSFRQLLQTPRPGASNGTPTSIKRGSLLTTIKAGSSKIATVAASDPAFKPRKVKKQSEKYRNRAEERRAGVDNDYSQVEAVLEDFERRNADNEDRAAVEAQRLYLGGDSDHSILVKGLDFALLEQNKARLSSASSKVEDESLEQAFKQAASTAGASTVSANGKKRSRADLIRELKEKRAGAEEPSEKEEKGLASVSDKFRPIGFKPIGAPVAEKGKKKAAKGQEGEGGERKKKKRKVDEGKSVLQGAADQKGGMGPPPLPAKRLSALEPPKGTVPQTQTTNLFSQPEPEPMDEVFDIFAGAGEYEGIDLGDDDEDSAEDGEEKPPRDRSPAAREALTTAIPESARRRKWFDEPEPEQPGPSTSTAGPAESSTKSKSRSPPPPDVEEGEEEEVTRLMPLASSAVPSIKELLAMDEAVEKGKKRKARKEKKGKGGGGDKLDRDYQRLKSYEAKKAAG